MTSSIVRVEMSGRAASCTKIISASSGKSFKPFAIEYCRSLPPTVTRHGLSPSASRKIFSTVSTSCAATTAIKNFTRATREKVFSVRSKIGSPASSKRFLFTPPPMRLLEPAAGKIAATIYINPSAMSRRIPTRTPASSLPAVSKRATFFSSG